MEKNEQILITIQKYFSLIVMEFKDHIQRYNSMFSTMCSNTKDHFDIFIKLVNDFQSEIKMNQDALCEMISKLNELNDQLPVLEEFYYKVKEMRIGLDKLYKELEKNAHKNSK